MRKLRVFLPLALLIFLLLPIPALAQSYLFKLDKEVVVVYWNEDGSASIDYSFTFTNLPGSHEIDFVDVGLPNSNFDVNSITADVDGIPLTFVSRSEYQGSGVGVAIGLGEHAIQPGNSGTVHVFIGTVREVLYPDDDDKDYVSAVFSPTWFGSQYVSGGTDLTVSFHLPPGVGPDDPRWHSAPSGFPAEPITSLDEQGRVVYSWRNPNANGHTQYLFGASFPKSVVPESAIVTPSFWEILGISEDDVLSLICCCGPAVFFIFIGWWATYSNKRRKLQYLPPKIAIEGHGIKRGLTAVEAAILLEQPLDKILTMILFGCVKKEAATVIQKDPLEIEVAVPLPEGLRGYETAFLEAFRETDKKKRQKLLQEMVINLVNSVSKKMKGFSRRETVNYYRDIIKRAWAQVEAADTPEVRSERFNQALEWTMLDKDYDDRTRDIFRTGPVFIPVWYPRFDPGYRRTISTSTGGTPISSGTGRGQISLPHLPGSDFAASVVNSVQDFSSGVIGNITEFTNGVTQKTNPVPKTSSSSRSFRSGSGGCACACACACAGCACACAGGGR